MKLIQVQFQLLLPLFSISAWLLLVAVPAAVVAYELERYAPGAPAIQLRFREFTQAVTHKQILNFAKETTTPSKAHFIEALNLPAFAVGLLVSRIAGTWPTGWTPDGMLFEQWNALSFPFYCLPFWWFVGRGCDALLRGKPLRWPTLMVGTTLCGFFLFLVLGLRFGLSAADREGIVYPFWGFSLWIVLFAAFPIVWVRQWHAMRKVNPNELTS